MSLLSPFEPDFQSLHDRGRADLWWFFAMLLGLISAGIPALIAHVSISENWLTALIAFVSYTWCISHAFHLGWKERTTIALNGQDLEPRIWAASSTQLMNLGFEGVGRYFGFEILARPIGEDTPNYDGHEFIIRNSKDTVAVANVMRIHDEAHWPRAIYEYLEFNGVHVSLSSVFEHPDVRKRIVNAQTAKSDFICVGLTTHEVETVGERGAESLSALRAQSLGEALISYGGLDHRRSNFYAIGLGQSRTYVEDGDSVEAKNQRSAVVIAITRRQDIPEILELDRITEALVQNYRTDAFDLSNYDFSAQISQLLRTSEIDFAGFV